MRKTHLYLAGLFAFLLGMPLTEKAFAQGTDIVTSAIDLGLAIANSAGQS
jgi:hypothetical protein